MPELTLVFFLRSAFLVSGFDACVRLCRYRDWLDPGCPVEGCIGYACRTCACPRDVLAAGRSPDRSAFGACCPRDLRAGADRDPRKVPIDRAGVLDFCSPTACVDAATWSSTHTHASAESATASACPAVAAGTRSEIDPSAGVSLQQASVGSLERVERAVWIAGCVWLELACVSCTGPSLARRAVQSRQSEPEAILDRSTFPCA